MTHRKTRTAQSQGEHWEIKEERFWDQPFELKVHLNNIKKVGPYLKENKPHTHYKDQPVIALQGNNHCLFWKSYETHTSLNGKDWEFLNVTAGGS